MTRGRAWRLAAVAAGAFVALDQATKQIAIHNIDRGEEVNVFFGIDLVNIRNEGVAFGALGGGGALIAVLVGIALAALIA